MENTTLDAMDLGRVLINGLLDEAINNNNNNNNMTLLGDDVTVDPVDDVGVTEFADPLSILNGPVQAVLLALLVILSIGANACVINNIRANCIKMRSTHFILIQHLCVADLIGASLILPAPLATSLQGRWEGGSKLCHLSSVVNVSLWLQHVFMFLMLKIDRVLAATLPIGRYPILTARSGQWLVLLAWLLALAIGAGVTSAAGARFEPSLLLCAPGLPHEFGITLVSLYCSAFASMVVGYVVLIIAVGRKKSKADNKLDSSSAQPEDEDGRNRGTEGQEQSNQHVSEDDCDEEEEEEEEEGSNCSNEEEEEEETAIDQQGSTSQVVVVGRRINHHNLVNGTPSTSSCAGSAAGGPSIAGQNSNNTTTTTVLVFANGDEADEKNSGSSKRRARRRRRRRRRREHSSANLKSAATSLIVTASHLLLYLPALLLLGLQGTVVNPVAAALCALIVYSEFLIHPMVLLSTSRRMRHEVFRTLKRHSPGCCSGC